MLNSIISLQLSSSSCSKLLSGNGITTSDLTIKGVHGIFGPVSIDARSAKKVVPAIGDVASAAKNLDEYQFLICSMVPSLPDSNPSKMELQKYRVAIIAAFAKLVPLLLLRSIQQDDMVQWSKHAKALLEETSDTYLQANSNSKLQIASHKDAFEYFEVPEDRVQVALRAFYDYGA
ncbi:MAG: hypothetical protein M3136_03925 [Thermoproteota archaeon]|nr:hypothetical protein [Thermoproteota archaeon]MDQ4016963.1 hypothetical protein [Thermoproteota archaeon]